MWSETEGTPKFEVADVHNSPHTNNPGARGPFHSGDRYELRFATMLDLIRIAYNVDPEKVAGGPSWLEWDRFDVLAKPPASSTTESRRQMLQALLDERFQLKFHKDNKPMQVLALTVPKHAQMKEADADGAPGCNFQVQNAPSGPPAPGTPITLPVINYTCKNTTMESFAAAIPSMAGAGGYLNNKLVVDQTSVKGAWDFSFHFTPKIPAGIQTTGEVIPLPDALEQQLGIKLEGSTVQAPMIVVDSVNRKPTENSAEAMKSFPPQPTEFEVASLKPTPPDAPKNARPDIKNGRVYLPGFSLKNLVMIGWDLNGDEFLVNAPKWLGDDKYDIVAKAPASVAIGNLTPDRNGIPVNIDALRPMIKALVAERFKIEAHTESRPLNAYILTAPKPKLKKAEQTARTKWQEGAMPDAKANKSNNNPNLGRLVTCQNVTMAQFAELLPNIAPGYLRTDVVDNTGLEGGYDFTFSFSPIGILNMSRNAGANGAAAGANATSEAADPTDAVSLFDALNRQLGLKLDTVKRPATVLVIDKMERQPIEN